MIALRYRSRVSMFCAVAACVAAASHARAIGAAVGFVQTYAGAVRPLSNFNSAGGSNTVTALGAGAYQVTLPGLGNGLDSNVQANAVDSNSPPQPHLCTSQGWGSSNGVDVYAYVGCFDFEGHPVSGDFSLFYQSRSPPAPGGWLGFLWADQPSAASYTPDASYNYNNRGGVNTVTRQSAGVYTATFPELRAGAGNPQVTAYSGRGGAAAVCQISSWTTVKGPTTQVGVLCFDGLGNPADEYFNLSYTNSAIQSDGAAMSGVYAYAFNPTRRDYNPHDYYSGFGGDYPTAQRNGGHVQGEYSITVSNPSNGSPTALLGMATAVGNLQTYCDLVDNGAVPSEFIMNIVCYEQSGIKTNTQYTATLFFNEQ